MHDCPCGCGEQIDRSRISCPRSWYRVPKKIRDEVWYAYRRGPGTLPHLRAVSKAIQAIKESA